MTLMNGTEEKVLRILSINPATDKELYSISGSKGHPGHFFDRLIKYRMVERGRNDKNKITESGKEALEKYSEDGFYTF